MDVLNVLLELKMYVYINTLFCKFVFLLFVYFNLQDFSEISDESWNLSLNSFNLYAIKCNILIEYNNIRLIGELQFALSSMILIKEKTHSIYSFLRKEELYQKLSKMNNINENKIVEQINLMILSQNINKFSIFLQTINRIEKYCILKNEKQIIESLNQSGWKKGLQLFQLIVQQLKNQA